MINTYVVAILKAASLTKAILGLSVISVRLLSFQMAGRPWAGNNFWHNYLKFINLIFALVSSFSFSRAWLVVRRSAKHPLPMEEWKIVSILPIWGFRGLTDALSTYRKASFTTSLFFHENVYRFYLPNCLFPCRWKRWWICFSYPYFAWLITFL